MIQPTGPSRPSPHRHAIAAGVLATLIAAFVASGPAMPEVAATALSDGLLAVAWLAGMAGIGRLLLPRRWLGIGADEPVGALLAATWAAVGIGAVAIVMQALGWMGWLNAPAAWAILLIGWAWLLIGAARWRRAGGQLNVHVSGATWFWLAAAPAAAVLIVGPAVLPGILWGDEPHGYDVVSYHLQIPREWFESGRITPLPHNVFSYFPLSMEMHYLLAMHLRGGPWAGMYLAQSMHAVTASMAAVAAYAAMRPRGRTPATIAGALTLGTPWTAMVGVVAYNEAGLLLMGTLAFAWVLRTDSVRDASQNISGVRAAAVAGVMTGFAYGMKMTAAAMFGFPLAVLLLITRRPIGGRAVLLGAYFLAAVGVSAPWWGRNLAMTGNPIFPQAANVLGRGHFSEAQVDRWNAAHAPRDDQRSIWSRGRAIFDQIATDWRYGYVLPVAGVLAGVMGGRDRTTRLLATLLVAQVLIWILFTHLQGRFAITVIPVLAMLIAGLSPAWRGMLPAVASAVLTAGCATVLLHRLSTLHPAGFGVTDSQQLWELHPPDIVQAVRGSGRPVVLVGDAKAFLWPLSVRYRTVFDVDRRPGQSLIEAWTAGAPIDAIIVVDPQELRRLARTYRHLGDPDAIAPGEDRPFVASPQ